MTIRLWNTDRPCPECGGSGRLWWEPVNHGEAGRMQPCDWCQPAPVSRNEALARERAAIERCEQLMAEADKAGAYDEAY